MVSEHYLINFGRSTKVSLSIFRAVYSSAQNVFTIPTRAYRRTYAVMDCSLETSERVHRILSRRKLALCASCGRVIALSDRYCRICGHGQHADTQYADVQVIDR